MVHTFHVTVIPRAGLSALHEPISITLLMGNPPPCTYPGRARGIIRCASKLTHSKRPGQLKNVAKSHTFAPMQRDAGTSKLRSNCQRQRTAKDSENGLRQPLTHVPPCGRGTAPDSTLDIDRTVWNIKFPSTRSVRAEDLSPRGQRVLKPPGSAGACASMSPRVPKWCGAALASLHSRLQPACLL